jgi:signal peptidase I
LAIECDVDVKGDSGQLSLDLVEGGVHYTCRIDVATGQAVLSIDDGRKSFVGDDGRESQYPTGKTKIDGSDLYRLRLSNCDDEVLLWVNNRVIEFDGPTTYRPAENVKPEWSPADAGDLEPAGVGASGVELEVSRLRLYRDVYYVASSYRADGEYVQSTSLENEIEDYQHEQEKKRRTEGGFEIGPHINITLDEYVRKVLRTREDWSTTSLFDARREDVEFNIGEDQFFPLGDNSPQSRDARVWSVLGLNELAPFGGKPPAPYVDRELLTGKALLIYWPHSWRRPVPFVPNIKRMGLIR